MAKTWPTNRQRRTRSDRNDVFARSDAIAARRVLRDVHIGLRELNTAQSDSEWRLRWVSIVTLLRSVGHVLDKVDGRRSTHLEQAVSEVWTEIKENRKDNRIYFQFIEMERNN